MNSVDDESMVKSEMVMITPVHPPHNVKTAKVGNCSAKRKRSVVQLTPAYSDSDFPELWLIGTKHFVLSDQIKTFEKHSLLS